MCGGGEGVCGDGEGVCVRRGGAGHGGVGGLWVSAVYASYV